VCAVAELPIHGRLLGRLDRGCTFDLRPPGLRTAGQLGEEQVGTAGQARVRLLAGSRFLAELAAGRVGGGWSVSEAMEGFVTSLADGSVAWA
jgi:hypothetical protein